MDSLQAVHVLTELHITDASPRTSGTGVPQLISAACNTAVINLESSVLLTQLDEVSVKELSKPLLPTAITGVAVSPCGSLVAAFTADAVYVAQLNESGQLQKAAQVTGAKSVQWCPGSAALAIICQQADPLLLVLSTTQGRFTTAATAAAEIQHLTRPLGATFGARHAAWLPQETASGTAALLAAWPSDVLLYTWAPTQHGSPDWHHPQVHRVLSGWPGPVRAITAVPADHKTSSCLVLGTVDAQLGLVSPAAGLTPLQQQQQTGVSRSASKGSHGADDLIIPSDGADDVLSSLMNIRSGPQQHRSTPVISAVDVDHHHHDDSADDHSVRPLGSSAAASKDAWQLSSASLCMMHINISDYNIQPQHNARSSSSSSIPMNTAAAAAAGGAISPSSSSFTSVLRLEHHPLPNLLTVQQQFIAVGSTKGPPLVTLCSFDSQSGLSLMQTVSIPLPTAAVGPDVSKMRLKGLLLAAAPAEEDKQQQGGLGCPFDSNSSSNMFPAVPLSGGETASALLTTPVNVSPRQHKQQQQQRQGVSFYPDIVALVSCSSAEQPAGHFANLSSNSTARTAAAAAAQVYLLNCRAPQQQQQQQRRREISSLSSTSSGDHQHAAVRQTRHKQPAAASPRQPAADQPPLLRYLNDSSKRLKSPSTAAVVADDALKTGVYEQQQQRQQEQQQRSGVDLAVSPGASSLCPWMHSLDSKHSEQNAEQQQQPAANQQQQNHDAACNDAGSLQQQQQLQVIQQQLTCIVQQQALHTAASDERLNRLVDCLTRLENSMTNRSSNTQYLDATVDALSKMQITLHCMMQSMQQQTITTPMNGAEPASPAATRDSDATVTALHKLQATLENVLATLVQQQQQQQQQHAQLCSSDSQAGSSTAAAFGSLQASIERLTDTIIQQQQRQQEAIQTAHKQQAAVVAAGLANLQVSLESRLDKLFQAQQQQQQQRPDDVVVSDALPRLQVSLEGKLDGVHQTLKEMVKVLAGLEEELAEVEQK